MTKTISTTISDNLHSKAKEMGISWAEAMRVGLTYIISEKEAGGDYDNPLQLRRRLANLGKKLTEFALENEALKQKIK